MVQDLSYQSLHQILDFTAQISELNLVYILYQEGYRHGAANMPPVLAPMLTPKGTTAHTKNFLPPPSKPSYAYHLQYASELSALNSPTKTDGTVVRVRNDSQDTVLQSYEDEVTLQSRDATHSVEIEKMNARIKICEVYILQNNWKAALQDLRAILREDANNSKCLAMLGVVYINTNQLQMAKASFKRSRYINPQEALALKHLLELNETESHSDSSKNKNKRLPQPNSSSKKTALSPKRSWLKHLLAWFSSWM
ncbi:MAG: tetratricopeptide repeat protein [Pseudanabaena sp.]